MPQQCRVGGDSLDHRTVGREAPAQDGQRAAGTDRAIERTDHFPVVHTCPDARLSDAAVCDGPRPQLQRVSQLAQQRQQSAGVVEVLHQVPAAWPDVGQHRSRARELVEPVERQIDPRPAGHRNQVNDRVRGAAEGQDGDDRVVE